MREMALAIDVTTIVAPCGTEVEVSARPEIITVITEWVEAQKGIQPRAVPAPIPSTDLARFLDPTNAAFMSQLSMEVLLETATVVSKIKKLSFLRTLLCATVASKIKGRTHEEIRALFV